MIVKSAETVRVAQLSHSDSGGGAGIAAYRLHRALLDLGVDSRMLVLRKGTDDPSVLAVTGNRLQELGEAAARVVDRAPLRLHRRRGDAPWSPGWFGWPRVDRHPLVEAADVVGLYWVAGGFLSVRQIGRLLASGKPVVWRLSDMWPFTGGCHYAGGCVGFEQACGHCPQLGSRHSLDLSRLGALRRHRWRCERLTVAAPSRWIADLARRSAAFHDVRVEIIPTAVDLDLYRPLPKPLARQLLRLPPGRRLLLFGASGGVTDARKGYDLLLQALAMLHKELGPDALDLAVFGGAATDEERHLFPTHGLGVIRDDLTRVLAYAAADLFIAPSREDNLPNTVVEALACGTPVVAFATGGLPETVEDGVNGHLAPAGEPAELARLIRTSLENADHLRELAFGARKSAEAHHDRARAAARYAALYAELVDRAPVPAARQPHRLA